MGEGEGRGRAAAGEGPLLAAEVVAGVVLGSEADKRRVQRGRVRYTLTVGRLLVMRGSGTRRNFTLSKTKHCGNTLIII